LIVRSQDLSPRYHCSRRQQYARIDKITRIILHVRISIERFRITLSHNCHQWGQVARSDAICQRNGASWRRHHRYSPFRKSCSDAAGRRGVAACSFTAPGIQVYRARDCTGGYALRFPGFRLVETLWASYHPEHHVAALRGIPSASLLSVFDIYQKILP
jgi:hypothetical protein